MLHRCRRWCAAGAVLAGLTLAGAPGQSWSAEEDDANRKVLEVWNLYDAGEFDRALRLAEGIHGAGRDARLVLTALLGFLYEEKGRNEEALARLEGVKPSLREALVESARKEGEKADVARHRSLLRLYNDVLRSLGFVYYRTGKCDRSVPELKELMGIVGVPNPLALSMIGSCLYEEKEYKEAMEYFEEAHRWYEEDSLREEAAYNVAAMNALQGKAAESAGWLAKALAGDRGRWLKLVAEDADFDGIRGSEEFQKQITEP